MKLLSVKDVKTEYSFRIRRNTIPFDGIMRGIDRDYTFDFNVYLPSKGFNLQRDFVWELYQKQQFIDYYYSDFDDMAKYQIDKFDFPGDLAYEYWDERISDDELIKWFMQVNFAGTQQDLEHFNKLIK